VNSRRSDEMECARSAKREGHAGVIVGSLPCWTSTVAHTTYGPGREAQGPSALCSVMGLVSRASPVHTALRNCTGDERGPFGFDDQVTDPKPPRAAVVKGNGRERRGNVGTTVPAVRQTIHLSYRPKLWSHF
jgi:hypothetical protein